MGSSPSAVQRPEQTQQGKTAHGSKKKAAVVLSEEQEKIRQAFIRQGKLDLYNSLHGIKSENKAEQKRKEQLRLQTHNKVQSGRK